MNSLARLASRCGDVARRTACLIGLGLAFGGLPGLAHADGKKPYSYFVTGTQYYVAGNLTPVVPLPTPKPEAVQPVVVMGGGPDVDEAYRWMIRQAGIKPRPNTPTGGRFVVIRTTGDDAYDPYFLYSDSQNSTSTPAVDGFVGGAYLGLTSAETLVLPSRDSANDPFVNAVVGSANALWIAGGDQSTYINLWKGTALESTIATLIRNNIPVGGTSAGANVLGQFVYSAQRGSVTSAQALGDPYNKYMTFDPTPFSGPSFVNIAALANTFVDPHFDSRDRMGRLVTFVSRSIAPGSGSTGCAGGIVTAPQDARGIGIDVETALVIQNVGSHYVAQRLTNISTTSSSAVHFLRPMTLPAVCAAGTPLTMQGICVQKLANSTDFDITDWWNGASHGVNTCDYIVNETTGVQTPAPIPY
ncbi:cyanophycinase [Cupriavidus pinatubonensis]|uniref:Cyanophycinase n=1 Tax=Cupriavidus pinatubonensis TaxID=248026 RepID=A0ABN7Y2F3_9BURK|nr:cyanophycinase [Cupriavidus pinatubonensis]CAG9167494.1 hypothetical protein LMG23994_01214 [Cupriavidus pinatubonensis]